MAKKISSSDLFDQEDIFKGIRDSASKTIETLQSIQNELKDSAKVLQSDLKNSSVDSAKGLKDFTSAAEAASKVMKEAAIVAEKQAKAEQQKIKADQELVKLEKLKAQEVARANKEAEKAAKLTAQESSAYAKLSKELNTARKAYKDLAVTNQTNTQEAQDLLSTINKLDAQLKEVDATVGQHQRNVGNYEKATVNLKTELRALTRELQNMSESDPRFQEMTQRAGELKDQIGDTADVIKATAGTGVENLAGAIGNLGQIGVGAFQGIEASMALFGVESEDVNKTIARMTALLNLSDAFQMLGGIGDKINQMGAGFTAFGSKAISAFSGMSKASKAFAVTGIGLLIVALGTVVEYWDEIKGAIGGVSEEQKKINKLAHDKFETAKNEVQALNDQDNILKLQGKSEKEILKLKIQRILTAIDAGKAELANVIKTSKAEEKAAIRNYNLTKKVVDLIIDSALFMPKLMLMPIDLAIKGANKISQALGMGNLIAFDMGKTIEDLEDKASSFIAGSLFNVEEVKAEGEKTRLELQNELTSLENQKAGHELAIKELNKKAVIDANKNNDDKLKSEKEYNDKLRAYYDAIEADRQSKITNEKEKELQEIDNKYEELYAKADAANQSDKDLIVKHQQEIDALNEKYRLIEAEKMRVAQEEANRLRIEKENEYLDQIEKLQEENYLNSLTDQEREIQAVNDKYFELEEKAKGNAEQLAIIEEAKRNELNKINENYAEKEKEKDKEKFENTKQWAQKTTDFLVEQSNKRIDAIDKEIEAAQKQADVLKNLAENGNIQAQQSLAEQERIIADSNLRKQQEQKKQQRIQLANSVFSTYASKVEAGSKNALAETIRDTTLLQAFINSIPAFYDGTEDTGSGGGLDGKGGFHAVLHPHERVLPKSLNDRIGSMSNEDLTRIAQEYQNGRLIRQDVAHSSMDLALLVNEMKDLKQVIKNKPETNIALGEITQSAMEIVERSRKGNTIVYNRFKVRK
jgi:Skp family chaperone for outer membrane proteins